MAARSGSAATSPGQSDAAVSPSELVAAARSEETRPAESWGARGARPTSDRLPRAGKRPIGGRRAGRDGDAATPNVRS
eukprot:6890553-Alexandrium_andersonii.AAC.1